MYHVSREFSICNSFICVPNNSHLLRYSAYCNLKYAIFLAFRIFCVGTGPFARFFDLEHCCGSGPFFPDVDSDPRIRFLKYGSGSRKPIKDRIWIWILLRYVFDVKQNKYFFMAFFSKFNHPMTLKIKDKKNNWTKLYFKYFN